MCKRSLTVILVGWIHGVVAPVFRIQGALGPEKKQIQKYIRFVFLLDWQCSSRSQNIYLRSDGDKQEQVTPV